MADLIKQLNKDQLKKLPKIGKFLDSGSIGSVYNLPSNRIIKISKIESRHIGKIFSTLDYLKILNSPCVSKIYEYGYIGVLKDSHYYYYITEKLKPLSLDENQYINLLCCYESNFKKEYYSKLNKKEKKFIKYLKILKTKKNLYHHDFHYNNIMQTKCGELKLVDLESFYEYF